MQAQRRMEELDRLFKRLYEDNISGKINDSRFEKLSADYENEQAELTEKMQLLEQEIAQQEEEADTIAIPNNMIAIPRIIFFITSTSFPLR